MPSRRRPTARTRDHIRGLFGAGCSLRGVLADQRVTQIDIAIRCGLPTQYVSPAVNRPGTSAASRLGDKNLRAIYGAAAALLGVSPDWIPEYVALD